MESGDLIRDIRKKIEREFEKESDWIIFPFGDIGMQVKWILNTVYAVDEKFIVDNHLSRYNPKIKSSALFKEIDCRKYKVFLASTNYKIYDELKAELGSYFPPEQIIELDCMINRENISSKLFRTDIGKYSYGPICRNHPCIESIGAFCSFASGVEVVANHEMRYLTTHDILSAGQQYMDVIIDYDEYKNKPHYMEGIQPKPCVAKRPKSKIGNDVWLGRNVTITNGANIGDGVIAGAGAVITKDVPDYAVVVGVPARIIRYRYTEEQIAALKRIKWWDWSDEKIRRYYDDFYLPIDEFIYKHTTENEEQINI